MSELPKEKPNLYKQKKDAPDEASWGEDQKKHEYYYDDAHGYEVYIPEEDVDDERAITQKD